MSVAELNPFIQRAQRSNPFIEKAQQSRNPFIEKAKQFDNPRYEELLRDIFDGPNLPEDFSLYLHAPTVTDAALNTGSEAFVNQPVYISYSPSGTGQTIFDYPAGQTGPVYS